MTPAKKKKPIIHHPTFQWIIGIALTIILFLIPEVRQLFYKPKDSSNLRDTIIVKDTSNSITKLYQKKAPSILKSSRTYCLEYITLHLSDSLNKNNLGNVEISSCGGRNFITGYTENEGKKTIYFSPGPETISIIKLAHSEYFIKEIRMTLCNRKTKNIDTTILMKSK